MTISRSSVFPAPILSQHFFPKSDPTAAILSTFAVDAVAFFSRPIGGFVSGNLAGRLITADTTGLSFETLYVERIIATVRPHHPLLKNDNLAPEAVMTFPIVMPAMSTDAVL
ncbi:hypothetical protein [Rhizobium anhuiense]|uniref:hypothetical protein n=1 Tax=Rhizobium anhuiense TaxID=1184720 RepID=UPI0015CEF4DA|nr:hypothetical protein [Rhizobium anhuiense]